MTEVYIAFGSNLGNRQNNISTALKMLGDFDGAEILEVSSVIETEPVGGPKQGKFLNGVVKIKTTFSPKELLDNLQLIENQLGRKREVQFGPRTIDLDILLYGDKIIRSNELEIPHPRMLEREFVMGPLKEIAPEVVRKLRNDCNKKH
jgi:2-amino-4-hydroxy-6-hydroxymethyldihydropteridine diphosphokinase